VAELADAQDLKSWGPTARAGSIPASGTSFHPGCPIWRRKQARNNKYFLAAFLMINSLLFGRGT
jgi:hypothetical protein